jgi:hypothetical protein
MDVRRQNILQVSRKIMIFTSIFRLIVLGPIVVTLAFPGLSQTPIRATGTVVLKKELQQKLDEWHKAGKFPGATLVLSWRMGNRLALRSATQIGMRKRR